VSWSQASLLQPFILQADVLPNMGFSEARRHLVRYCPTNAFPRSPRKSTPEEEEEEDVDKTGADGGGDEERDEP
jgi:hypothetical protein